jgi:ATP-dependent Clp protease ATP-binding subunit ClpA
MELIESLKLKIVNQLKKCKNSIIVIDDIQQMMAEVFLSLEPYLLGLLNYKGGRLLSHLKIEQISTKEVIFIFTSDLGSEDLTRNKDIHQLKAFIHERISQYSSDQINQHLQHIPFQSLDEATFDSIISREMKEIPCKGLFGFLKDLLR